MLLDLLTISGLIVVSGLLPGPNLVLVIGRSLASGRQASLFSALGLALGALTHATLGLLGVGLLIQANPSLLQGIKIVGAVYLIWLGLHGLLRARRNRRPVEGADALKGDMVDRRPIDLVKEAWLVQMANPETSLFFVALFSSVIDADLSVYHSALLAATVFVTAGCLYAAIAITFSASTPRNVYRRSEALLDGLFGAAMLALGLLVAASVL